MLLDDHGNVLEKKIGVILIETYWTELDTLIAQATKQLKTTLILFLYQWKYLYSVITGTFYFS
jgi:sRNA-binding protein